MHYEDRLFWDRCRKKYPRYFSKLSKVIEFGSYNVSGSIRDSFPCSDYTGIDWIEGPYVDIVSLAHEVDFPPETFDLVVSASMLEHDPYWKQSITKMVEVLKPDGLLAISWGAARNLPHYLETAPDGKFHALKAGLVLWLLGELGMYVHEFQYDRTITETMADEEFASARLGNKLYGLGEVVLVAFKDKAYAIGEQLIDPLQDVDRA